MWSAEKERKFATKFGVWRGRALNIYIFLGSLGYISRHGQSCSLFTRTLYNFTGKMIVNYNYRMRDSGLWAVVSVRDDQRGASQDDKTERSANKTLFGSTYSAGAR